MHSRRSIDWHAPVLIVSSFLGAIGFAVAHHVFNQSLAGTPALSDEIHFGQITFTLQTQNMTIGVALAFFFRACLAVTVSASYIQCFWRAVGKRGIETRLSTLDRLHSVLENIWSFLWVHIWWKYSLLLILAVISWCLPIAAIISPATLTVVNVPVSPPPTSLVYVPNVDFKSLKLLAAPQTGYGLKIRRDQHDTTWTQNASVYNGPSYVVERIANSVAAQGKLLPIHPPSLNVSWTSTFRAPSIKCADVNSTLRAQMLDNILQAFRDGTGCAGPYSFLSWTATPGFDSAMSVMVDQAPNNTALPFHKPTSAGNRWPMNVGTVGPLDFSAVGPEDYVNATQVATIYFAVIPNLAYDTPASCSARLNRTDWSNSTFIQCELQNTTYSTNFTYVNGEQQISFSPQAGTTSTPVTTLSAFDYLDTNTSCATMNAQFEKCVVDPTLLEKLSFQAVMDAFGKIFVGYVVDPMKTRYGQGAFERTSVMQSVLLDTPELAFLTQNARWTSSGSDNPQLSTMHDSVQPRANLSLKVTLEKLFENITISLLSSPNLQPNTSSLIAPAKVNITQNIYRNQYDYSESNLWLTYGIALGITMLVAVAGFAAMMTNGAAFSNDFSTILRASRTAKLSEEVRIGDADGKDPLPQYLSEATVGFVSGTFALQASKHGAVEIVSYSATHYDGISVGRAEMKPKKTTFLARIRKTGSDESNV